MLYCGLGILKTNRYQSKIQRERGRERETETENESIDEVNPCAFLGQNTCMHPGQRRLWVQGWDTGE